LEAISIPPPRLLTRETQKAARCKLVKQYANEYKIQIKKKKKKKD